jgi:hypothetical protein
LAAPLFDTRENGSRKQALKGEELRDNAHAWCDGRNQAQFEVTPTRWARQPFLCHFRNTDKGPDILAWQEIHLIDIFPACMP